LELEFKNVQSISIARSNEILDWVGVGKIKTF
jgi:hypothetical protein